MANHKYIITCPWTVVPAGEAGRVNLSLGFRVSESDTGKEVMNIAVNYSNLSVANPAAPKQNTLEMFGALWGLLIAKMVSHGYVPTQQPNMSAPPPQQALTVWENVDYSGFVLSEKLLAQIVTWLSNFGVKVAATTGKTFTLHDDKLTINI